VIWWPIGVAALLCSPLLWALVRILRQAPSPAQRWCDAPEFHAQVWVITDANGHMTWCPTCMGRLS
jgi:hypothetical protein